MNISKYIPIVVLAMAAFVALTQNAHAQTANMTADVTVQNTLTLATPAQLDFGTIAAIRDPALTASVTINTSGTISTSSAGGTAATAIVDGSSVSAGQVTVADGADGATLNVVINNVVDPVNVAETFVLDGFNTSWNSAAAVSRTIATPWTQVFDGAFGGGINTLDIGASLTTTLGAGTAYTDGAYAGTYDVVFSY